MGTSIAGIVLRAKDRKLTARFYEELGLQINEHKHGGAVHYEVGPASKESVWEIYLSSPAFLKDTLMLHVESIEAALSVVARYNIPLKMAIQGKAGMKFVYVTDPDGRAVMLIENK